MSAWPRMNRYASSRIFFLMRLSVVRHVDDRDRLRLDHETAQTQAHELDFGKRRMRLARRQQDLTRRRDCRPRRNAKTPSAEIVRTSRGGDYFCLQFAPPNENARAPA